MTVTNVRLIDVDLTAGVHGVIRVHAKTVDGEFWEPKTKRNRAVPGGVDDVLHGNVSKLWRHQKVVVYD